jgi:hypothetical protein
VLQSFEACSIPFVFFSINEQFDPVHIPRLQNGEYFLYPDYFGLKGKTVRKLYKILGNRLILDNSQNYFARYEIPVWSFNSVRKFLGMPDGSYVYGPQRIEPSFPRFEKYSLDHLLLRSAGDLENGFKHFVAYENKLTPGIARGSLLTEMQIKLVDHVRIKKIRRQNFEQVNKAFEKVNRFKTRLERTTVPMVYPLMFDRPVNREKVFSEKIFMASYWPEIITRSSNGFLQEKKINSNTLFLPIDQRYNSSDMKDLIRAIKHSYL